MVLAGDIGGRNARLAIVERFMSDITVPPVRACFGVACRVIQGVCRSTHLPWAIEESQVKPSEGGHADQRAGVSSWY